MLLGTLIKNAFRAQDTFLAEMACHDLVLTTRIRAAAERQGLAEGDYVATAIRAFLQRNDGGEWTTLMGRLQDSDAPGMAFIETVVRRKLAEDGA